MKFFLILTIFVLIFVLFNKNISISEENSKFYVDGQIHPAYSIKIVINGKLVEEVMPDKESVKFILTLKAVNGKRTDVQATSLI